MSLGRFSVKNPVLINILMVCILILGGLSILRLPREQFAEVPFYWANIVIPFPGVAAEDVERTVTIPVERAFNNMKKVKALQSVTSEGLSVVRVELDDGISDSEFQRLYQEVQSRFNKVQLPEGILEPTIDDFSASDFLPVIEVVLWGDISQESLIPLAEELEVLLEGVPEVADVNLVGAADREIFLSLSPGKMESLGLSLGEILRAVQGKNTSIPGGTLTSDTRDYLLRTIGEMENVEEFGEILLRRSQSGRLMIRDVAALEERYRTDGPEARFNGKNAVTLRVTKVSGGNSIGVIERIKSTSSQFMETLPPGVQLSYTSDSTIQIRDSLNILISNSVLGLFLLVVILYLFIGLRNALITGLGIPVTFALTFLILEGLGETLNSNTLFGLVLVLGMIVDHAIVIIENSYRFRQLGKSREEAAIAGTDQVIIPVIAATLTTVAAFLPLMLLPGIIGKFLRVIPLVVTIALLVSTGEALVFLPSHFAEWSGPPKKEGAFFQRLQSLFRRALERVYGFKKRALFLASLVALGIFMGIPLLRQDLFSAEDFSLFYIDVELPPGTNKDVTRSVVQEMEELILPRIGQGEVVSLSSYIGFSSGSSENVAQNNLAQILVDLTERKEGRSRSINAIMEEIRQEIGTIPGPSSLLVRKAQSGPPTDPPVTYRMRGNSYQQLGALTEEIEQMLQEDQNIYNVQNTLEPGSPELRIRLLPDRAAELGISVTEVGSFIRGVYDGLPVSSFFKDNQEILVRLQFDTNFRSRPEDILSLRIPSPSGGLIPFSSIAYIEEGSGLGSIKRVDGEREVSIAAEAYDEALVPDLNQRVKERYEEDWKARYPDVELLVGGEFAEFASLLFEILRIFLIGVFLIYLILGVQFNSYLQPFLILLTVPFAFAGVILFLLISGTPFSTTVLYAGVALAGIAVNDSIVLISFANELKDKGMAVKEALLEAASTRLRPILLTSVTTIAGLLPTAIGLGGRSVVWGPMASSIIFGLLFSTLTALVIIPLFYGIMEEGKLKWRKNEK